MIKLDIIYEDKNILVINKASHLLTIQNNTLAPTLYQLASSYVKKQHKSNKIFIVHRLDKDTSGVIVFAKAEKIKRALQENWNNNTTRKYVAILEGNLKQDKGVIKNYLVEDKLTHKVFISPNNKGSYAETSYEVIKRTKNNTIVIINIKTGKKNQIRVAFSSIKHPIIGDKKYGSKTNPIKRLGLHAYKLNIKFNGKDYTFLAKLPKEFQKYLGGNNEIS